RLGAYPALLKRGSRVSEIYGSMEISERHRHRYEVNTTYKDSLEQHGMRFSGMSPDGLLPEMIEYDDHPWFIGVQFHPELKSRPFQPHPLFASFVGAAVDQSRLVLTASVNIAVQPTPNPIVSIGSARFGNELPLALIAGPCALESRAHAFEMVWELKEMTGRLGMGLVYKTSFDKANRTSGKSGRGIGLDRALAI